MDIERLSKVQIVLLTLLVSFITSIATGIVTVSLMDQAPPSVEQTVNRVIERTVQTVVPPGQSAAAAVTQEKTVIVNQGDLISQAVNKTTPSIVRVFSSGTDGAFLGLGIMLDASGTVATDGSALGNSGNFSVELSDGSYLHASVVSNDAASGIAYLAATSTGTSTPALIPAVVSGGHAMLGDTVVVRSGNAVMRVGDGIVTALIPASDATPQIIDTSITAGSVMDGSPLIDSSGDVLGLSTGVSRAVSASGFVPGSAIISGAVAPIKK